MKHHFLHSSEMLIFSQGSKNRCPSPCWDVALCCPLSCLWPHRNRWGAQWEPQMRLTLASIIFYAPKTARRCGIFSSPRKDEEKWEKSLWLEDSWIAQNPLPCIFHLKGTAPWPPSLMNSTGCCWMCWRRRRWDAKQVPNYCYSVASISLCISIYVYIVLFESHPFPHKWISLKVWFATTCRNSFRPRW